MTSAPAEVKPVLLIVDDEPGMVSLVSRFGADQGFDVIGRAAWAW